MYESLLSQREAIKHGAIDAFNVAVACITSDSEAEFRSQHLVELAQGAATRGMWEEFSEHFGADKAEELAALPDYTAEWFLAFSTSDHYGRVRHYLDSNDSLRTRANLLGAISRSGSCGATAVPFMLAKEYLNDDPVATEMAHSAIAVHNITIGNWSYLANIDLSLITPTSLLSIAHSAAREKRFDQAKEYICFALEHTKDTSKTPQTTQRIISEIAHCAIGALVEEATNCGELMTTMHATYDLPEHPLVDLPTLRRMQTFYGLTDLIKEGEYEVALTFMLGEDNRANDRYSPESLKTALVIRDWDAIMSMANSLPSDTLCLLANVAVDEGETEVYEHLLHTAAELDPMSSRSFYNPLEMQGEQAAAALIRAARQGDWERVNKLFNHTPTEYTADIARLLVTISIRQDNIAAAAHIAAELYISTPAVPSDLFIYIEKNYGSATAQEFLSVLQQEHGYKETLTSYCKRQTNTARLAAESDDWPQAIKTLRTLCSMLDVQAFAEPTEELNAIRKKFIAPGSIALIALQSLRAIKQSEVLQRQQ